jgi:hypothetical protein
MRKPFFIRRGSSIEVLRRIHPYALYQAFGIPSHRWVQALTRQVAANDEERAAIARYLSSFHAFRRSSS